ncbi:MAG: N-formylglutamate amidohydrolase [Coriobacteriia bacterium]
MPAVIRLPRVTRAPVIAHVPHASTVIGERPRGLIVLDDHALTAELARVTDWHVDELFDWVRSYGGSLFVNQLSRLVFDPERFRDGDPAEAVGQGVVYTRTSAGAPLAEITAEERAARIRDLYDPYHEGLTALVSSTLARFGVALILDCHSFPVEPLPTELHAEGSRPDICIGTDTFHTPQALADALKQAFRAEGLMVHRDSPFAGTLVPLEFLGKDPRVMSVMIEVRRDLYCDEATGERNEGFGRTQAVLEPCVGKVVGEWARGTLL